MADDPLRPCDRPGNWSRRRLLMYAVTAFCMGTVAYVLVSGAKGEAAETAVSFSYITLISVVGSYVFGASWADSSILKLRDR